MTWKYILILSYGTINCRFLSTTFSIYAFKWLLILHLSNNFLSLTWSRQQFSSWRLPGEEELGAWSQGVQKPYSGRNWGSVSFGVRPGFITWLCYLLTVISWTRLLISRLLVASYAKRSIMMLVSMFLKELNEIAYARCFVPYLTLVRIQWKVASIIIFVDLMIITL